MPDVHTLLPCLLALLSFVWLVRRPRSGLPGVSRVSRLSSLRFVLSDLLPWARGQAPLLRRLHEKYGPALQVTAGLFSFAPSGDAAADADLFKAISRLPKSERVYSCFDVPVPTEKGDLKFHQTIFTARQMDQWRPAFKAVSPMFRVQAVRDRQNVIWQTLGVLTDKLDILESRNGIDLTPLLRAFAADVTCSWLVQVPYGALESLKDGQSHKNPERDIGPILNSLNRQFGVSYHSPATNTWLQGVKAGLDQRLKRWGRPLWHTEQASLDGWTQFVEESVKAGFDPPGSFSEHFASLMLDGKSSAQAACSAQLMDAIFAGTDTLTATLSLALYTLAVPSTVTRVPIYRIRRELPEPPWQLQSLESLPWLSATVKECLRIADANPHLLERVIPPSAGDLPLPLSALPVGSRVGVAGYVCHRSKIAYGHDPNGFFPRRWLPVDHPDHALPPGTQLKADELQTAYMPFGRAPRACIAQSFATSVVTCVLATVISKYDLEQRGPSGLVEKGWRDCFNKVLFGAGEVKVALEKRRE